MDRTARFIETLTFIIAPFRARPRAAKSQKPWLSGHRLPACGAQQASRLRKQPQARCLGATKTEASLYRLNLTKRRDFAAFSVLYLIRTTANFMNTKRLIFLSCFAGIIFSSSLALAGSRGHSMACRSAIASRAAITQSASRFATRRRD